MTRPAATAAAPSTATALPSPNGIRVPQITIASPTTRSTAVYIFAIFDVSTGLTLAGRNHAIALRFQRASGDYPSIVSGACPGRRHQGPAPACGWLLSENAIHLAPSHPHVFSPDPLP